MKLKIGQSTLIKANIEASMWQDLLAFNRFLAFHYQTCHWLASGQSAYAEHLLFEKIYKAVNEDTDGIAERSLGISEDSAVDLKICLSKMQEHLEDLEGEDFYSISLKLEEQMLDLLKQMDAVEDITIGTRDFINGLASEHEQNVYLLKLQL